MAYTTLSNLTQNTILTAGTYYLSTNVNLNNFKLTFDCSAGSIIVKKNGNVYFTNVGIIETINSNEINKVYFTVKNDDTIGEIISGSTGTPSRVACGINNGITISNSCSFIHWEIRYQGEKGDWKPSFFVYNGEYTRTFQHITFKNCLWFRQSPTGGGMIIFNISGGITNFEYIDFDNTNSIPVNAFYGNNTYFATISSKINAHHISIENFGGSQNAINFSYTGELVPGQPNEIKNLRIKGFGGTKSTINGLQLSTKFNTNLENISITGLKLLSSDTNINANINFKNCLFDKGLKTGNYAVSCNSYSLILNFQNCIFKNYKSGGQLPTDYVFGRTVGTNMNISVNNSIITNNDYIRSTNTNFQQSGDYNCFYSNLNDNWIHGSHDFNKNPGLSNVPSGCIINSNFSKFIEDGNFVSGLDGLQGKGSDTFDNLSIDENLYTATGYKYLGTHFITPGINYLVDVFYSDVSYAFEIDTFEALTNLSKVDAKYFNVPQRQIIAIENELGTNPKGSMLDLKTRLAVSLNDDGTLKVSIPGETGLQGITGIQGIQGNLGIQGIKGESGIQGIQGEIGLQGIQGDLGIQGIQGQTGPEGDFLIKKKNITVSSIDGTFNFIFSEQGFLDYFNSNYKVYLTPIGVNATKCWAVVSGSKTTSGFTISCVVAGTNGTSPYNATENGGGNINIDVITVPV